MDSTTLAYLAANGGDEVTLVSFDYGQRHRKELDFAAVTAEKLGAEHVVVPMDWLAAMIAGESSLVTPDVDVPLGHYAEQTMRATVVPNRNAIMLNVAIGLAISRGAERVATGVHAGDHFIYPDCRPAFISALNTQVLVGMESFLPARWEGVWAPFVDVPKDEIARVGNALGVPWEDTWSCYQGGDVHCGACGTCFERREAFTLAGVLDPTVYAATPDYEAPA
jgi:7-cyano-7-deazaguanine synthase